MFPQRGWHMEWANTGAVLGTFDVNEALGLARVLGEEFCVEFTSRFDMTVPL